MSGELRSLADFADRSRWPMATCPEPGCGYTRPHPVGGEQRCDQHRTPADEGIVREVAAEREWRRSNLPSLLARAGCPPRYRGFTRAAWEASFGPWGGPVTGRLVDWTGEEPREWLVLFYGSYGRRKTSLATALLGERILAGKRGLWWDSAEWVQRMQAGIRDDSAMSIYESAAKAEVLLLDDIGSVIGGREGRRAEQNWWAEQLALLLRHRESWIKPTIATANVESVVELAKIDESLVSRCDVSLAFRLTGPDYRTRESSP